MAGFVICEHMRSCVGFFFPGCQTLPWPCVYLQLIEAEREVEDLGELFGQGLLPLQVLHGRVRRAGQRLQQASQGIFCRDVAETSICWNQKGLLTDYGWTGFVDLILGIHK